MADENSPIQGLSGAHTPPENSERAAKIGTTRAATEAAMADLAAELAPAAEPEQQSLLLDDLDDLCLFKGPVRHVAETLESHRRGRGRPAGSQNKASKDFADTLMRMGYRHPGLNLAALANASPAQLAAELGCTAKEAADMILKANAELMPYFESKAPVKVQVDKNLRGVMLIGDMRTDTGEVSKAMDLTVFPAPDQ